jgi:phosphoribosylaminoimidazolecarboxamide formyltransferase/IMP cyclohydrolase
VSDSLTGTKSVTEPVPGPVAEPVPGPVAEPVAEPVTEPFTTTATGDGRRPIRRALISVHDKAGLEDLARALHRAGVALVSTGGSAVLIERMGIPVTRVEELTGFPECLDGRVKTLHPSVHAGLLADTRKPDHVRQIAELGIEAFDLVVSNLYPFRETVLSGATIEECIEQIDIGGPSMVRASAKNHASVAIVTSPTAYPQVMEALAAGGFTLEQRRRLAAEAFARTATYDCAVANWMGIVVADTSDGTGFPSWTGATFDRAAALRYGENPHQKAALYRHWRPGVASAPQLHGKEMSYNNYVDTDAAVRAAHDQGDQPTVAIVKHANPCGIAVADTVEAAYAAAHACDPGSAYGGIIATNVAVTRAMALAANETFSEVIAAPDFEPDALDVLREKKNRRLLRLPADLARFTDPIETRAISGGLLVQTPDRIDAAVDGGGDDVSRWRLVSGEPADAATLADLQFAWHAVRAVKSNAVLLASGRASVGIGMGQVNRVDSCHLAVSRAGADRARGAVAASDAFFPFADGLHVLIDAGVRAVVAPGGSVRDPEVIQAASAAGVTMYFTGTRHFAH